MLGKKHRDVIGLPFFDVFPMVRDTEVHANYARAIGERRPLEFEMMSPIMLRVVAFSVYPTKEGGISVYFRDITERKRAEMDLSASRQRMQLATETTGIGVWEWNVEGEFVIWDAQMFRIYGVEPTPDGVVRYDVWKSILLPEELPQQEELLRRHLRKGGVNRREFQICRRSDCEVRTIEAMETLRYGARGEVECVVGVNLDITERRQAEGTMRRQAEMLRLSFEAIIVWRWDLAIGKAGTGAPKSSTRILRGRGRRAT